MIVRMFTGVLGLLVASILGISEIAYAINNNSSHYPGLFWMILGLCIILLGDNLDSYLVDRWIDKVGEEK